MKDEGFWDWGLGTGDLGLVRFGVFLCVDGL